MFEEAHQSSAGIVQFPTPTSASNIDRVFSVQKPCNQGLPIERAFFQTSDIKTREMNHFILAPEPLMTKATILLAAKKIAQV